MDLKYFNILLFCVLINAICGKTVIHERCPDSTKPSKRCIKDSDCPRGTSCFDLLYFENGICCPQKLFNGGDTASSGRVRESSTNAPSMNLDGIPVSLLRRLARQNWMVSNLVNGGVKHISDTTKEEKLLILKQHLVQERLQKFYKAQAQAQAQAQSTQAAMNQATTAQPAGSNNQQTQEKLIHHFSNGRESVEIVQLTAAPVIVQQLPEPPGPTRPVITQNTCAYSGWSSWTRCSERCGTGSKTRIKKALRGQDDYCNRILKETRPCNTRDCRDDGGFDTFFAGWAPSRSISNIQRSQSRPTLEIEKPAPRTRSAPSRSRPATRSRTKPKPKPKPKPQPQQGGSYEAAPGFGGDWISNFNQEQERIWKHTTHQFSVPSAAFNSFRGAESPAPPSPGSCKDKISSSNCVQFKRTGYCSSDPNIKANCLKTCGAC